MLGLLKDLRIGGWCEIEQITCWVLIAVETFPGISAKSQIAGPKKGTGRGLVLSWEQSSGWRVYKIEASGEQNIHRFLQLSKTEIWVTHVIMNLSIYQKWRQTDTPERMMWILMSFLSPSWKERGHCHATGTKQNVTLSNIVKDEPYLGSEMPT